VGVWLAVAYPYVMAALMILPKIYRVARRGLTTAYRRLGKLAGIGRAERPVTRLL
jgi:alkylated DNA nucleotide flippase Atl1